MPQVIRTTTTKIITKNGESELSIKVEPIVIELTINVNGSVEADINAENVVQQAIKKDDPKVMVAPDFGPNTFGMNKIKFGKNVGEE